MTLIIFACDGTVTYPLTQALTPLSAEGGRRNP